MNYYYFFFYYDFKFLFNMILMSEKKNTILSNLKKMLIKVKIIIFIYHSKH